MNLRNIRNDRRGGIEGLPLQLMIVILVATMGTAIIVGWMGNIETPQSISEIDVLDSSGSEIDGVITADNGIISSVTIKVRDQDGNFVDDALVMFTNNYVSMEGNGSAEVSGFTKDGTVVFENLRIDPPGGSSTAILEIYVYKADYGEKTFEVLVSGL